MEKKLTKENLLCYFTWFVGDGGQEDEFVAYLSQNGILKKEYDELMESIDFDKSAEE